VLVLAAALALGAGGAAKPRLSGVFDVAVAPDGSVLIGDRSDRILRFRGGRLTVAARIGFPVEVAPDPRGGFAVVSDETAIRRVDARGRVTTIARNLRRITALAFDPAGNLYFSELPDRVRRLDRATGRITVVAEGGLNWPHGLVVAGDRLYLADTFNHRVVSIELATGEVRTAAAGLNQPVDVDRGPDGAIYVADYGNGRLARIQGGEAATVARLIGPNSVWVRGGTAYVSERIFPRVRRVDLATGAVRTVVGGL
jgi:streptogramin lyase